MTGPTIILALMRLIELHSGDGSSIIVEVDQIVSLRSERTSGDKLYSEKVHCMINTTDGNRVTVMETCDEVRKMLEAP